jgi:hypothetical protein
MISGPGRFPSLLRAHFRGKNEDFWQLAIVGGHEIRSSSIILAAFAQFLVFFALCCSSKPTWWRPWCIYPKCQCVRWFDISQPDFSRHTSSDNPLHWETLPCAFFDGCSDTRRATICPRGPVDSPLLPVNFGQCLSQQKPALGLLRVPLQQNIVLMAGWTM